MKYPRLAESFGFAPCHCDRCLETVLCPVWMAKRTRSPCLVNFTGSPKSWRVHSLRFATFLRFGTRILIVRTSRVRKT